MCVCVRTAWLPAAHTRRSDGWPASSASIVTQSRTKMNATSQAHCGARLQAAVGLTAVLVLAACASTPPPTASLQAAHQAISNAERAEAGHYAPAELNEARSKLASADPAVSEGKRTMAAQLAEESNV